MPEPDKAPTSPRNPPLWPLDMAPLDHYLDMLVAWNRRINLTGYAHKADILANLVYDSFYLAQFLSSFAPKKPVVWDLGSGAGLPGIPLLLAFDAASYIFVEIREKRALFLVNAICALKLAAASVFRGSVEKFFASADSAPDIIVSRAFRPWPAMLELCQPIMAKNSRLVLMANEAPPPLPDTWRLESAYAYEIGASRRWLWALACGGNGRHHA